LHPTGASLAHFSGGRQQQDETRLARILIELRLQSLDALDVG